MATADSTTTPVEYRDIPGFPGYRAGDDGTVWSCWERHGIRGRRPKPGESCWRIGTAWRLLTPVFKKSKGRHCIEVAGATKYVHQLILLAFAGPCPDGMEACHGDGDRTNNRANNLRWDTKLANAADRDRHGTTARGERTGGSKLSNDTVAAVHRDYSSGQFTQRALAIKYGVRQSTISGILLGKNWRHVIPSAGGPEQDSGSREAG